MVFTTPMLIMVVINVRATPNNRLVVVVVVMNYLVRLVGGSVKHIIVLQLLPQHLNQVRHQHHYQIVIFHLFVHQHAQIVKNVKVMIVIVVRRDLHLWRTLVRKTHCGILYQTHFL